MVRRGHEYNGAITRDVEGASGSYFTKEHGNNKSPEEERDVVRESQGRVCHGTRRVDKRPSQYVGEPKRESVWGNSELRADIHTDVVGTPTLTMAG